MKVYRMEFDIAVLGNAPDVYTLEGEIREAIEKSPFVVGTEGALKNALKVNGIDASVAIDRQVKENFPIDLRPCLISPAPIVNESEVRDDK